MIRIVFSGTHKGFSHWYASDLKYPPTGDMGFDDPVYKRLLDRRFLYPLSDRLDKTGYSFQPISTVGNRGIFFHKILLLSDHFGREGFMMASIFMPEGEWLKGRAIREALDRLVDNYKSIANMGQTVVELDWSFVDHEAEALNQQMEPMAWNKFPPDSATQGPALIKGLGVDDVDFYFNYPHPLYVKLSSYEQVFLTEELLSPTLTGYIVLDKNEVDPTNPDIIISRPSGYTIMSWTVDSMKMKDLEAACSNSEGKFVCGRVSLPGYKEGEAFINIEDIKNLNGRDEVKVTIPKLKKKEAEVTLQLEDNENKDSKLNADDFTIEWNCEGVNTKLSQQGMTFAFEGEQCDKLWTVSVFGNRHYEKSTETIRVSDGDSPILPVYLERKKKCAIKVSVPETYKGLMEEEFEVYEDEKQSKIEKIKKEFEQFDLRVVVIPGLNVDEVIVTEWPEWKIIASTRIEVIKELKYKGSKEGLDKKIDEFRNHIIEQGYEFASQDGPHEDENDNWCILRFEKKMDSKPIQSDTLFINVITPDLVDGNSTDTINNTNPDDTGSKPDQVDTNAGDKPDQGDQNLVGGNGDKMPEDITDEVSKIFYIPLDGNDLLNYPLFKNYVTPEKALKAISELLKKAKPLKDKDNNKMMVLEIVNDLRVVENNDKVSFGGVGDDKLAEEHAKKITDVSLRKLANKAIEMKKKSFVIEGNDSVRYNEKLHCLTWEGLRSQRPEPNDLQFKESDGFHYKFANDPNHQIEWADTLDDAKPKYKVNMVVDQKGSGLLDCIRNLTLIKIVRLVAVVFGLFLLGLFVYRIITGINESISIFPPSCKRQKPQEEIVINPAISDPKVAVSDTNIVVSDSNVVAVSDSNVVAVSDSNVAVSKSNVADSLKSKAYKKSKDLWKNDSSRLTCIYRYAVEYLKPMHDFVENEIDSSQRKLVIDTLIFIGESDSGYVVKAMTIMKNKQPRDYKKDNTYDWSNDLYFGSNSMYIYFWNYMNDAMKSDLKGPWFPETSTKNSETLSAPTVLSSQGGQNPTGQKNLGTGSGTDGSTNSGNNTVEYIKTPERGWKILSDFNKVKVFNVYYSTDSCQDKRQMKDEIDMILSIVTGSDGNASNVSQTKYDSIYTTTDTIKGIENLNKISKLRTGLQSL